MIEFFKFDLARDIYCQIKNTSYRKYNAGQVFGIPIFEYYRLNRISKSLKYVRLKKSLNIVAVDGWNVPVCLIKDTDIEELKPYVEQNMDFIRSHPELANYT